MDGECSGEWPVGEGVPGDSGPYEFRNDFFLARWSSSSTRMSGTPSCGIVVMTAVLFSSMWRLNLRRWYLDIVLA